MLCDIFMNASKNWIPISLSQNDSVQHFYDLIVSYYDLSGNTTCNELKSWYLRLVLFTILQRVYATTQAPASQEELLMGRKHLGCPATTAPS